MSDGATLGRAALVVSGGILLSRVLGFLRDVVMAGLLGRTLEADLYADAFLIPDYLLFLLAGGYLSITLVPILTRHDVAGDPEGARRAFTAVFRLVALGLVVLTVASMLAAEPITELVFPRVPEQQRLAGLTRIALASQIFFGLGALLMAAQYAKRRFLIPTLAPIVYNLGIIAGGAIGQAAGDASPEAFLWGGLIGAIVGNFGIQAWGAMRVGMRLEKGVSWRHPATGEYLRLALPLMVGQSVVALDEQWPRLFGQLVGEGATAGLAYARRLNMLPVGVIAQAAGVAAYPFLARLVEERREGELRATVGSAVRTSVVAGGLATALAAALATPIVRLAYERGAFRPSDTAVVASLLVAYALSIPFWSAHQVYTRGFYAARRMWVPVGLGTAITAVTIPAMVLAAPVGGASGVAAVSVGSVAAYALAVGVVWHRTHPGPPLLGLTFPKTVVASIAAYLAAWWIGSQLGYDSAGQAALSLLGGGLTGVVAFLAVGRLIRLAEIGIILNRLGL